MATSQSCHQYNYSQAWSARDMTVWNQNRERIHRLFLLENLTLAQVKHVLESEHGFPEFRLIDYEVVLREHFGFRKNLKKEDWLAIDHHREDRRKRGKTSNVYLQGLLIEKPRVDRAVRRSKHDRKLPYRSRQQPGITIRTPSPVLPSVSGAPYMSTANTMYILPVRTSGQSAYQVASGQNTLPINICTTQRQLHGQISVKEMRLHLPFMKFAETIKVNYNIDTPTAPSSMYTGDHHTSGGSSRLPENSNIRTNSEVLGGPHQIGTERQKTTKERREDRLTARNIAFVGGKFEFDKLMRVFFVLSNKQEIHEHEGVEIIEWIESADLGVLRALFSLPLSTVAAAWEQLILISNVLKCQNAFSKLLEPVLLINNGEWLEANAADVLGTAIWLGLGEYSQRFLRDGLSPNGYLTRGTPFLGNMISKHKPYNGEYLRTPLQVAIRQSDAETMMNLFCHGAKPDDYDIEVLSRALLGRNPHASHDNTLCCLNLMLNKRVDIDTETIGIAPYWWLKRESSFNRLGWLPEGPRYLSDLLWHHSANETYLRNAFDLISKRSTRMKDSLTVPGLCEAASRGCGDLLRYLNSRSTPSGSDRGVLLEIALYQTAFRGDLNASKTFIQMGIDPNVQEMYSQSFQPNIWDSPFPKVGFDLASQWVPAFQASKNYDTTLLQILFNAGVDCNQHNLLNALLSGGEEQWTSLYAGSHLNAQAVRDNVYHGRRVAPESVNDTYNFLLAAGLDIQIHGSIAMVHAVTRWGETQPEVASLQCDWLYSKGVGWDAEFEGRNLVHCAVVWGCNLDLIRFFVARGVKVHSSRCNEGTTMLYDALNRRKEGSLDVINFLLHQGVNALDQSYGGVSILQPALLQSWGSHRVPSPTIALICRRLIEAGATIFSRRQAEPSKTESPSKLLAALIKLPCIEDDLILRLLESDKSIKFCYVPECIFTQYAQSPMEAAIERGRLNLARELLQRGRNEHEASLILSMALIWSTKLCVSFPENRAASDFMIFLMKSGADIEVLGARGLNSLHHAAAEGSLNVAATLLENGANPNTPMRRASLLYHNPSGLPRRVADYRHPWKGEFGIDEGIAYDEHGHPMFLPDQHGPLLAPRPLDLAASHGRLDMVQLLLSAGAISGHPGITPYDGAIETAQYHGHCTIVRLLEQEAAKAMSIRL